MVASSRNSASRGFWEPQRSRGSRGGPLPLPRDPPRLLSPSQFFHRRATETWFSRIVEHRPQRGAWRDCAMRFQVPRDPPRPLCPLPRRSTLPLPPFPLAAFTLHSALCAALLRSKQLHPRAMPASRRATTPRNATRTTRPSSPPSECALPSDSRDVPRRAGFAGRRIPAPLRSAGRPDGAKARHRPS